MGYRDGRYRYREAVDDIFEELYGIRLGTKLVEADNDSEVCTQIELFGTNELILLLNNEDIYKALVDMVNLFHEIKNLENDIKKNSRNNRETPKRVRKRLQELREYYNEAMKSIRKYLGLEKLKGGFGGKYRNLEVIKKGGKKNRKSKYDYSRNNLFGDMDDEDLDDYLDYRAGGYDIYDDDDDEDDYDYTPTPKVARNDGIYGGEFGAMLEAGTQPKKKKKNKPEEAESEYETYQRLHRRYCKNEKKEEVPPQPTMSAEQMMLMKMMEMMTTNMCGQKPTESSNIDKLCKKIDEINDTMDAVVDNIEELNAFADSVTKVTGRAAKYVDSKRQAKAANIRTSTIESDDDDDEDDDEPTGVDFMDAMKNGCTDKSILIPMVNEYYDSVTGAENTPENMYYEQERVLTIRWITAFCNGDQVGVQKAKAAMVKFATENRHLLGEDDDDAEDISSTPSVGKSLDELMGDEEESVGYQAQTDHPVDKYNEEHAN